MSRMHTCTVVQYIYTDVFCSCLSLKRPACVLAVFRYSPKAHNVVPVSAAGYRSCSAPRGVRALTSGNDRVTLKRGVNYFICSFPGHCQAGMKVAVTAA